MGKIKDREFWESAKYNNRAFMLYYDRLLNIALSRFKWTGVPNTIDIRFLELALLTDGKVIVFYEEGVGYLGLRCAVNGQLNVYGIPISRRAYANNGFNRVLDENNSVIIWNSFTRKPTLPEIENCAKRLWDLDRTIDVNANAQKTPILISCDDSQRLTLKNAYMQFEGNMPVIYTDKNINPNSIKVMNTQAPYIGDKIQVLKSDIWNEEMTYLGVTNITKQKKERLITDEVIKSQGGTIACRNSFVRARQQGCIELNKLLGLDMWCEFNDECDGEEAEDETNDSANETTETNGDSEVTENE